MKTGVKRESSERRAPRRHLHYEIRTAGDMVAGQQQQLVGGTGFWVPGDPDDEACATGEGDFEFVLLATSRPVVGDHPAEKVVLQVVWRDGIVAGGRGHSDAVRKSAINSCHIQPSSPGRC